ncbi:hypothetical protein VNI00_012440 [Paramarasmius palmivorus]|uniref:DUF6697 domain-containing protein n=1 Tax=Paramarasmius palmivorus TaxID=297713 RepID=A0AAW0C8H6_9AGAR
MSHFVTADFDFDLHLQQPPDIQREGLSAKKKNELNRKVESHNDDTIVQTEEARCDPANVPIGPPLRAYYAYTHEELERFINSEIICRETGPLPSYLRSQVVTERTKRGIPVDGYGEQSQYTPRKHIAPPADTKNERFGVHSNDPFNDQLVSQLNIANQAAVPLPDHGDKAREKRLRSPAEEANVRKRMKTKRTRSRLILDCVEIPSTPRVTPSRPMTQVLTRARAMPPLSPIPQYNDSDSEYLPEPKKMTPVQKRTIQTVVKSPKVKLEAKVEPPSTPSKPFISSFEYYKQEDIKAFIKAEQTSMNANRPAPLRTVPPDIPTGVSREEELVTASRQTWSDLFGGKNQGMLTKARAEKQPDEKYRNFMFINREHNPDAPWYPGGGGLLLRRAGMHADEIDGKNHLVVTQIKTNQWRLMGLAQVTMLNELSPEEWKGLSPECKDTWISTTLSKRTGAALEIRARITLGKQVDGEPTDGEVVRAIRNAQGTPKFSDVTRRDIEEAFDSGRARLSVFAIQCIEYPIDIQKQIIRKTGAQVGVHASTRTSANKSTEKNPVVAPGRDSGLNDYILDGDELSELTSLGEDFD